MDTKYELDILFLVLTGKVSLAVNRMISRSFKSAKIELTPEQFTVLARLWETDAVTQQQLCDDTNKDKPSITRLIDSLEKPGLVQRVSDPGDRRTNLIHLTPKGKQLRNPVGEVVNQIMRQALEGVSAEQMHTCQVVLNTVLKNIS